MAKANPSIYCEQEKNLRFDDDKEESKHNSRFVFKVVQTANTMEVHIGKLLKPFEVQHLIDRGVHVRITDHQRKL